MEYVYLEPTLPTVSAVYHILCEQLHFCWYEIFSCLGVNREILDGILARHPFDSRLSLREATVFWVKRDNPLPTWKDLVSVIRYKILEDKVADTIEQHYVKKKIPKKPDERRNLPEYLLSPPPKIDRNCHEFSDFIMLFSEKLGPDCYPEFFHFLEQYRSPDGTQVFDEESRNDHRTIDSCLLPVVYSNMCNPRDVDMARYVLKVLDREDLLPIIQEYIPKIDMGEEEPLPVHEASTFVGINVVLGSSDPIDILRVSSIKRSLCVCFCIQEKPHLLQYLGWEGDPAVLTFQMPMACNHLITEGVMKRSNEIQSHGIVRVVLEVNSVKFSYDLYQNNEQPL